MMRGNYLPTGLDCEGTMEAKLKLMLVDDHKLIRLGLRALTSGFEDVELVADCTCSEALDEVRSEAPDVVMINLTNSEPSMCENLIRDMIDINPDTHVLVIGNSAEDKNLLRAFRQGALGCLLGDSTPQDIYKALYILYEGGSYLPPMIGSKLIQSYTKSSRTKPLKRPALSPQQMHVLRLVSQGLSNQDIASQLYISKRTAEMHVYKIFKELNVTNRSQAIQAAILYGILDANDMRTPESS
jgi:DNA-binding NarL/FixJ family response regulator